MTEQEIFEKLKDALDNNYLFDSYELEEKEVDNLQDYLILIKRERALEKDMDACADDKLRTYEEFIHYLNYKAIGDTTYIIEEFDNCEYVGFEGYKKVTKEIVNNKLVLNFEVNGVRFKANWQEGDNYGVWQTCGYLGDDYSGYMLFPTHNHDEYFVLNYRC